MIVQYDQQLSANKQRKMYPNENNNPETVPVDRTMIYVNDTPTLPKTGSDPLVSKGKTKRKDNSTVPPVTTVIPTNEPVTASNAIPATASVPKSKGKRSSSNKRKYSRITTAGLTIRDDPDAPPSTPVRAVQAITRALQNNDEVMSIATYTTGTAMDDSIHDTVNNDNGNDIHPPSSVPPTSAYQMVHGRDSGPVTVGPQPIETNLRTNDNPLSVISSTIKSNPPPSSDKTDFATFREQSALAVRRLKANQPTAVPTSMPPPQPKRKSTATESRTIVRATKGKSLSNGTNMNRSGTKNSIVSNVFRTDDPATTVPLRQATMGLKYPDPPSSTDDTSDVASVLFPGIKKGTSVKASTFDIHPIARTLRNGEKVVALSIAGGGDIGDIRSTCSSTVNEPSHKVETNSTVLPLLQVMNEIVRRNNNGPTVSSVKGTNLSESEPDTVIENSENDTVTVPVAFPRTGTVTATTTASYRAPGQATVLGATELANLMDQPAPDTLTPSSPPAWSSSSTVASQQYGRRNRYHHYASKDAESMDDENDNDNPSSSYSRNLQPLATEYEDISPDRDEADDDEEGIFSQTGLVMNDGLLWDSIPDDLYDHHNHTNAVSSSSSAVIRSHKHSSFGGVSLTNGQVSTVTGAVARLLLHARHQDTHISQDLATPEAYLNNNHHSSSSHTSSSNGKGVSITDLIE